MSNFKNELNAAISNIDNVRAEIRSYLENMILKQIKDTGSLNLSIIKFCNACDIEYDKNIVSNVMISIAEDYPDKLYYSRSDLSLGLKRVIK